MVKLTNGHIKQIIDALAPDCSAGRRVGVRLALIQILKRKQGES